MSNFVSLPEALYAIDGVVEKLPDQDDHPYVWVENQEYRDGLARRRSVEYLWGLMADSSCRVALQLTDGSRIDCRREWLEPYESSEAPAKGRFVELSVGILGSGSLKTNSSDLPHGELVFPRRNLERLLATIEDEPPPSHSHAAMVRGILAAYQDEPGSRKADMREMFPLAGVRALNRAFKEAGKTNKSISNRGRKPGRKPNSIR